MPYTDEEFNTIFNELPEDVKEAMTAVDTVNIMMELKTKYNLHIDQLSELSAEVGMLMLGITHPQDFIGKVEASLRVPHETAKLIATEVNEKIFRPVRESLVQIHNMEEAPLAQENTPKESSSTIQQAEIPEENDIKNNTKNEKEELFPEKRETKDIAENKLTEPFSMPQKTGGTPDPYRESVG
jgi:hypothetical protein